MRYIGIDPGSSGGIAAIDDTGAVWSCPMPKRIETLVAAFERLTEGRTRPVVAVLEHVWSSPGWGHAGAFTFGVSFGMLQGVMASFGIRYHMVVPVKWMNAMEVRTPKARRDELGHADKNIMKARASALYPGLTVTHAIADALLLATYARQHYGLLSAAEGLFPNGKTHSEGRRTKGKGQARRAAQVAPSEASPSVGRRGSPEGSSPGPALFADR
jgi:hypothetical protein